ncbi:unnamed protein product [Diplocarpon coronariae]
MVKALAPITILFGLASTGIGCPKGTFPGCCLDYLMLSPATLRNMHVPAGRIPPRDTLVGRACVEMTDCKRAKRQPRCCSSTHMPAYRRHRSQGLECLRIESQEVDATAEHRHAGYKEGAGEFVLRRGDGGDEQDA